MSEKIWSDDAWRDYLYWQAQDMLFRRSLMFIIIDARML